MYLEVAEGVAHAVGELADEERSGLRAGLFRRGPVPVRVFLVCADFLHACDRGVHGAAHVGEAGAVAELAGMDEAGGVDLLNFLRGGDEVGALAPAVFVAEAPVLNNMASP